jgi:hypothetical protein
MTAEQASALIAQNDKILGFLDVLVPLVQFALHDVFPVLCVAIALYLGVVFGAGAVR